MTRRDFLQTAGAAPATISAAQTPLILPIRRIMDIRTKCTPEQMNHFWWRIWPEAVRSFGRAGIELQCTDVKGEIKISPGDRPIFAGLERGVINLLLTDHLPMAWDKARSMAGMTTLYEGYLLCVIAISYAHGYQVPFLSTNTCVHELLHLLLQDVFVKRPKWYQVNEREARADWYTRHNYGYRGVAGRSGKPGKLIWKFFPAGNRGCGLMEAPGSWSKCISKLFPAKRAKNAKKILDKGSALEIPAGFGSQKSEVRSQKSEVRSQNGPVLKAIGESVV